MATIVLQAAGAFLGGFLGPVGFAIGRAAGAMAGYMLDRSALQSLQRVEGPRLSSMKPFLAEEGAPLARLYGTVRVGGNVIWATRFEEASQSRRGGAKGGPKVTTYSYYANAAFALCEGEIAGVRRIWADGRELDLEQVTVRVHRGSESQPVDPLIAAKQGSGNAPAYRGVAYVVFERFPLDDYGNRLPQFQFEVMRPVDRLNEQIRSVVLLPGSTEYGLLPRAVTRSPRRGETVQVNRNVLHGASDLAASLDELQALCPDLQEIAVVVTWFGSDLRAGACTVRPAVMYNDASGHAEPWEVCGVSRAAAATVSFVGDNASYGGTPSDRSVIECIAEIRRRGLRVALYPFMMMDIPPDNALPNPYGGAGQPAFPWRGRITCSPAPGQGGSADRTDAARSQVNAFCGAVSAGNFAVAGGRVTYAGAADDWGYRRLVLHYAHLAVAAGGVDTFLLGSEMRGLTTLRDGANAFPFVEALCQLAGDVRGVLGAGAGISYGADWSEYFGHQPADGSGDVYFHLDALWAHEAVSAVGIDNYMPLSDWRDEDYGGGNPDGFAWPYDLAGLRGQIGAGEGFDWYYASDAARSSRNRSSIAEGAYGKPWVYRYKDIRSWWENQHFDRIGGVEAATPTAWVPRSKPIWFTELGCPAVDKGPNQPNVFPDALSSENAVPYFSSGGRSDIAQAHFLRAHMDRWSPASGHFQPAHNPISPVYGGRMVDPSRLYVWAWDARPFPAFPADGELWSDSANWHRGHWLNGRLSGVSTAGLIRAILTDHGLGDTDTDHVGGSVAGYAVEAPTTARSALEPVVELHGIGVRDEDGTLVFRDRGAVAGEPLTIADMVVEEGGATLERTRLPRHELPDEAELAFANPFLDYQASVARSAPFDGEGGGSRSLGSPGCLETGAAAALVDDWLRRAQSGRESVTFSVPPGAVDVEPGALVTLPADPDGREYLVTAVETGMARRVSAMRTARAAPTPWRAGATGRAGARPAIAGAPYVLMLDLPAMPGSAAPQDDFRVAAYASPWKGQVAYSSPEETGFAFTAGLAAPATMGELVDPSGEGVEGRFDTHGALTVALYDGELSSISDAQLLNGGNTAAMRADNGEWEIVQFAGAEEIAPSTWRLTRLLRGQQGTGDAMKAGHSPGTAFVLLDDAVGSAGLSPEQAGLTLNWRVGPQGEQFGGANYVELNEAGGVRSRLPLSPVHLRLARQPDGAARLTWTRRGRVDADNWLAEDIPLGEEFERYRVEIRSAAGTLLRTAQTGVPNWTYGSAHIAADLPALPAEIGVTIRQISATVGAGLPATKRFHLT
jgi:hypothetical protein